MLLAGGSGRGRGLDAMGSFFLAIAGSLSAVGRHFSPSQPGIVGPVAGPLFT